MEHLPNDTKTLLPAQALTNKFPGYFRQFIHADFSQFTFLPVKF